MPAGTGGGPGGSLVNATGMSTRGFLVVDRPRARTSFVCFLTCIDFGAFPPFMITVCSAGPGPGGGGGGGW